MKYPFSREYVKGITILSFILLFAINAVVLASTFYKYTDEAGTVVITQSLQEIPPEKRKAAQRIEFSDEPSKKTPTENPLGPAEDKPLALKEIFPEDKIKAVGEETLARGQAMAAQFFKDQFVALIACLVGGIIVFWLISKLLKRLVGNFITQIVIKLGMVVVLFSGVYLLYLSWLNKNVLNFNQAASTVNGENLSEQITTPGEIIEQTENVVEQFNQKAKEREALLHRMGQNPLDH